MHVYGNRVHTGSCERGGGVGLDCLQILLCIACLLSGSGVSVTS